MITVAISLMITIAINMTITIGINISLSQPWTGVSSRQSSPSLGFRVNPSLKVAQRSVPAHIVVRIVPVTIAPNQFHLSCIFLLNIVSIVVFIQTPFLVRGNSYLMKFYIFRIGVFVWYPFLLMGRIKIIICLSQYLLDCYICLINYLLLLPPQHFHDFCF